MVLIAVSWLAVIAADVLAPVLPKMAAHFADVPRVDLLIGLAATIPALAVALLAVPIGHLADRVGARRILIAGLAGFGLLGLSPMILGSLHAIVASRFLTGICEAAVMTTATALLAGHFSGRDRDRWLTIQVASVNLMGVVVVLFGGLAGRSGWRLPFLAYGFALLLLVPVIGIIRQPRPLAAKEQSASADGPEWSRMIPWFVLTTVVSMSVYVVVIQFSFLLTERGVTDPGAIGPAIAVAATGMFAGSGLTVALLRFPPLARLAAALLLIAGGAFVASIVVLRPAMIASMWLIALGAGIGVPTLLALTVGTASEAVRGKVTGAWTSALFLGQFLNPMLFVFLRAHLAGETMAIRAAAALYGLVLLLVLLFGGLTLRAAGSGGAPQRPLGS